MAERVALAEIRARTYKDRDAWWTVWLVDPLAARLVRLVSPWPAVTPNRLTVAAFLLGIAAAACFWQQTWGWLVAGAALFHLSFVLDCMDGKIARLNGTGSVFGAWLDYIFDRLRVLVCTIALMGGQYLRTGDFIYVWLAGLVLFLDLFRYLNALQMNKVKSDMRTRLAVARGESAPIFLEEGEAVVGDGAAEGQVVDMYGDFHGRFGSFRALRSRLFGRRIRAHLFSGIEFQMFVFIVGPATSLIIATTLVSAALLIAFELLLIYKLWSATKSFARHLAEASVPAQRAMVTTLEPSSPLP
jgi:phosphatidylglycerophosphate synthase